MLLRASMPSLTVVAVTPSGAMVVQVPSFIAVLVRSSQRALFVQGVLAVRFDAVQAGWTCWQNELV
jgi:hypothetical protein